MLPRRTRLRRQSGPQSHQSSLQPSRLRRRLLRQQASCRPRPHPPLLVARAVFAPFPSPPPPRHLCLAHRWPSQSRQQQRQPAHLPRSLLAIPSAQPLRPFAYRRPFHPPPLLLRARAPPHLPTTATAAAAGPAWRSRTCRRRLNRLKVDADEGRVGGGEATAHTHAIQRAQRHSTTHGGVMRRVEGGSVADL